MKIKRLTNIILIILFFLSGFLAGCSNDTVDNTTYYMVSYVSRVEVENIPKPCKVSKGSLLSSKELPDLYAKNYTFIGWYLDNEKIQPALYQVEKNIILTAAWTGKDCAVIFTHSPNISGQTFTKVYNLGEEITLPENPYGEKTGLNFLGWLCGNRYYSENEKYTLTGDTTFTAFYAETGSHTISYYNVADGLLMPDTFELFSLTGKENPFSFTESQIVFISAVESPGYTFEGWFNTSSCTTGDEAKTFWQAGDVCNDVTLYAKWTMNTYTIRFDGNSASLIQPGDEQESLNARYVDYVILPESKYELSGYDFAGWTTDPEHFETEFDALSKVSLTELAPFAKGNTITLYAHWYDADFPFAPEDFLVKDIEEKSVTLSWKSAANNDLAFTRLSYKEKNAEEYTFKDFAAEELLYDENGDILETVYTVEGLDTGKTYSFTVTSYDVAGNANAFNSECTQLVVPRSSAKFIPVLSFEQQSPEELTISWDSPSAKVFPFIEKIELYIDENESSSYTAVNGAGDCYTKNSFTVSVEPATFYKIQLKISEMTDESGKSNPSETTACYLSKPKSYDFYFESVEDNKAKDYYRYGEELGFNLKIGTPQTSNPQSGDPEDPTDPQSGDPADPNLVDPDNNKIHLYAECTELSDGIALANTTSIQRLVYDENRELYIRTGLEAAKDYQVKIFVGAEEENDGKTYVSYSQTTEKTINCRTAELRRTGIGYFCYSSKEYYPELQKTRKPIAIVTAVDQFGEPLLLLGLKDLDTNATGLIDAERKIATNVDGGFIWSLPSKSALESIFSPENKDKVFTALEAAGGNEFEPSIIDENGISSGRYITSTHYGQDEVYVFEIDGQNCSEAFTVQSENSGASFRLRPFVSF